jgi:hypothetical protein
MPTNVEKAPLWLSIEEKILEHISQDLSGESLERTIHQIASDLDEAGHNVSSHGGHMLQLRAAVDARLRVGKSLMEDFNAAVSALELDDVAEPYRAAMKLIGTVGATWPQMKEVERRQDVLQIVEKTKLNLLIANARSLTGDEGVRFLIRKDLDSKVIMEALGISEEKLEQVSAAMEAERQERARVGELLSSVENKSTEEKVEFLITNNVSDTLIVEIAEVDQGTVDDVNQAIAARLEEQRRQDEEAAARRKAEAEGPPLEDIPSDKMLDYIEAIREILEFSDQEKEIRVMCEQSDIPKCLVDITVSEPEKLDELEEAAEK